MLLLEEPSFPSLLTSIMVRSRDSRRGQRSDLESGFLESSSPFSPIEIGSDLNSFPLDDLPKATTAHNYEELDSLKRGHYSKIPLVHTLQRFIEGPEYPVDDPPTITIQSLIPFERFPSVFKYRYSPRIRFLIISCYISLWFLLIHSILAPHLKKGAIVKDNDIEVVSLSCNGAGHFWRGKNQQCGLDGSLCGPFEDRDVIVKCPALCDKGWTYSSTPVGDEMVKYRQFTIGGGKIENGKTEALTYPYRGDSFPCSSAVHGGVISAFSGGCVRLSFDGSQLSFKSQSGHYGSGSSIEFPSFFPSSFVFKALPKGTTNCYDPRLLIMILNFVLGAPIMYISSGSVGFWISSIVGFWTVVLTLDPPLTYDGNDPESVARLVSAGFQRLLPLCFVLYVVWISTVKTTLQDPSSPIFKTFVWYPLLWVGIANNITFDRLPVDRLTPEDIKQLAGGLITIVGIVTVLVISVAIQGYHVWKAGKLKRYLEVYGILCLSLVSLTFLPGLQLRIHHYILGLVLLPGTSTKGSTAFILQGVLLGLLISGVARWNFDSIVESHVSLMRGEAGTSSTPPANLTYLHGVISWSGTVFDEEIDPDHELNGYSLLVNDIERYVGNDTSVYLKDVIQNDKELLDALYGSKEVLPIYLRVAKSSTERDSSDRGDYTMAGTIEWPSGEWLDPLEGVT